MSVEITVFTKHELTEIIRQELIAFNHTEKQTQEVMTITQLCKYLSITKPTVYNRIEKGLPVSYALCENMPRFVKNEIDQWLKESK